MSRHISYAMMAYDEPPYHLSPHAVISIQYIHAHSPLFPINHHIDTRKNKNSTVSYQHFSSSLLQCPPCMKRPLVHPPTPSHTYVTKYRITETPLPSSRRRQPLHPPSSPHHNSNSSRRIIICDHPSTNPQPLYHTYSTKTQSLCRTSLKKSQWRTTDHIISNKIGNTKRSRFFFFADKCPSGCFA